MQITKLLFVRLSPASFYFLPFGSNIFPRILFSHTPYFYVLRLMCFEFTSRSQLMLCEQRKSLGYSLCNFLKPQITPSI